jgi:carboxyl-terminal processing protease
MKARVAWIVGMLGVAAGTGLGIGLERYRRKVEQAPVATAQTFESVLSAIRENFVDSLTDAELYAKAAKGVVNTLGDPYSTLLSRSEYRQYREILDGEGVTLGLALASGLTGTRVQHVIPGSPADRAGITRGDFVLDLDGQSPDNLAGPKLAAMLHPQGGEELAIRVRSPGDTVPVAYTLAAKETEFPAVQLATTLTDSVGYLSLRTFSTNSSRAIRKALDDLHAGSLSGAIIDLRDNPGGRLDEGLATADLFLEPGQRIGAVAKRGIFERAYNATHRQPYPKLRLVLLVNGNTASSAEIVAAALKDHQRAVLVGERTRGKGLIQTTIPLGESLAVRLSTLRWQSPGGTSIVGGILPDSVVLPSARSAHLLRLLGNDPEVVARNLEILARAAVVGGARTPTGVTFGPLELERFRSLLREDGRRIERGVLDPYADLLDVEFRRLVALMTHDRAAADRWSLAADPVVAAALAKLAPPIDSITIASQVHHP